MATQNQKNNFQKLRYLILLGIALFAIFSTVLAPDASAQDRPRILEQNQGNTSDADDGIEEIVNIVLYFCLGASVVTIAAGLFVSLPIVGKKEMGIAWIKNGVWVLLISGLFTLFIGFLFRVIDA